MKAAVKSKGEIAFAEAGFPKSVVSISARKSFEKELARLRSLSVEERILEALSLQDVFSWLEPVEK